MDNTDFSFDNEVNYSRSHRSRRDNKGDKLPLTSEKKVKVSFMDKMRMLFWSIFISCLSIAVPIFTGFVNSIQSQNIMAAFSLSHNILPYSNIQVSGGFFYYAILALAYHFGSLLWVIPFFAFALYVSSLYLYKLCFFFTQHYSFATVACLLFYLANLCIGFGGLYPLQFGMPFFLLGFWYLVKYFCASAKDELFIAYGFIMALALLFEPAFLIFDLVAFLVLIVFNVSHKRIGRGFYQFLCIVFGVMLIGYVAGYFLFNMQLLSVYIKQTVFATLLGFSYGNAILWQSALFQFAVLFATGVVLAVLSGLKNLGNREFRATRSLLVISLVFYAIKICLTQDFQIYHVLIIFPLTLVLIAINLGETSDLDKLDNFFLNYFLKQIYLPLILLVYGLFQPIVTYFMQSPYHTERSLVANYLNKKLSSKDNIYAWDNVASLYILTKSSSSSRYSIPVIYNSSENQTSLDDNLLAQENKYIIVNNSVKVSSTVEKLLKKNYKAISISNVTHFTVYELK